MKSNVNFQAGRPLGGVTGGVEVYRNPIYFSFYKSYPSHNSYLLPYRKRGYPIGFTSRGSSEGGFPETAGYTPGGSPCERDTQTVVSTVTTLSYRIAGAPSKMAT